MSSTTLSAFLAICITASAIAAENEQNSVFNETGEYTIRLGKVIGSKEIKFRVSGDIKSFEANSNVKVPADGMVTARQAEITFSLYLVEKTVRPNENALRTHMIWQKTWPKFHNTQDDSKRIKHAIFDGQKAYVAYVDFDDNFKVDVASFDEKPNEKQPAAPTITTIPVFKTKEVGGKTVNSCVIMSTKLQGVILMVDCYTVEVWALRDNLFKKVWESKGNAWTENPGQENP